MRVAPLGAYFADDLSRVVEQARASSLVTHTHPEGVAGTIAIAIATAKAWQLREAGSPARAAWLFDAVLEHTPESKVWRGLLIASQTPATVPVQAVAKRWVMVRWSRHRTPCRSRFGVRPTISTTMSKAITSTISGGGDCDTNAAIVGGIVELSVGRERISRRVAEGKRTAAFLF